MAITREQVQAHIDDHPRGENKLLLRHPIHKRFYLHNYEQRITERLDYDQKFTLIHGVGYKEYWAASESEKMFIAVEKTFREVETRIQNRGSSVDQYIEPLGTFEKETLLLESNVHVLMKLAMMAFRARPLEPVAISNEKATLQLQRMIRVALIHTQNHIAHTTDADKAAGIILDTQKFILDEANDQTIVAEISGKPQLKSDVVEMYRLAMSLLEDERTSESIHTSNTVKDLKDPPTLVEGAMHIEYMCLPNDSYDAKLAESFGDKPYNYYNYEPVNFRKAFESPQGVRLANEDINKTWNEKVEKKSIARFQKMMYLGYAATRAQELFDQYVAKGQEIPFKIFYYTHTHLSETASVEQKLVAYYLEEYVKHYDQLNPRLRLPKTVHNDTLVSSKEFTDSMQLLFEQDKLIKSTLFEACRTIVKSKLQSKQPTHASDVASEIYFHLRSPVYTQIMTTDEQKKSLEASLKAFKAILNPDELQDTLLSVLYLYNPMGALLDTSMYWTDLLSELAEEGKKAPQNMSAAESLLRTGTLGGQREKYITPTKSVAQLIKTLNTDGVRTKQLLKAIRKNEMHNPRHALKEILGDTIAVPSFMMKAESANKPEIEELYRAYLINMVDYMQETYWNTESTEITQNMWAIQNFYLRLLTDNPDFTLGKTTFTQNTELIDPLSQKIINYTLQNLSNALARDTAIRLAEDHLKQRSYSFMDERKPEPINKPPVPYYDLFVQMLKVSFPFMSEELRRSFIGAYGIYALNADGALVYNGRLKQISYSLGMHEPALLPRFHGKKMQLNDRHSVEGNGIITYYRDDEIAQDILDMCQMVSRGWVTINGRKSNTILLDLEQIDTAGLLRGDKSKSGNLLFDLDDIIRNISPNDVLQENYDRIHKTVVLAIIDAARRRFQTQLPQNNEATDLEITKISIQAEHYRELLNSFKPNRNQKSLTAVSRLLKAIISKIPNIPKDIHLDSTKALLDAVKHASVISVNSESAVPESTLRVAAELTGDAFASATMKAILEQVFLAVETSGLEAHINQALRETLEEESIQFAIIREDMREYADAAAQLRYMHHREHELRADWQAKAHAISKFLIENPALRAIFQTYNVIAPEANFPRIDLRPAMFEVWMEADKVIVEPDTVTAWIKDIQAKIVPAKN